MHTHSASILYVAIGSLIHRYMYRVSIFLSNGISARSHIVWYHITCTPSVFPRWRCISLAIDNEGHTDSLTWTDASFNLVFSTLGDTIPYYTLCYCRLTDLLPHILNPFLKPLYFQFVWHPSDVAVDVGARGEQADLFKLVQDENGYCVWCPPDELRHRPLIL